VEEHVKGFHGEEEEHPPLCEILVPNSPLNRNAEDDVSSCKPISSFKDKAYKSHDVPEIGSAHDI
jgi:hypothetical protein